MPASAAKSLEVRKSSTVAAIQPTGVASMVAQDTVIKKPPTGLGPSVQLVCPNKVYSAPPRDAGDRD